MAFGSWNNKIREGDNNIANRIHGKPPHLVMNQEWVEQLTNNINNLAGSTK